MNIILVFFIAISLSMDAFSLSLAYGTIKLNKKEINLLSMIVGIYHFIMPIIGMFIGSYIAKFININEDVVVLIIFSLIGINMVLESKKEKEEVKKLKLGEMILFGFAVSIDSFSLGIGLTNISNNIIMCFFIFSLTSFIFTYIGLILGNKINELIGKIATLIGGISLILLGFIYMICK